VNASNSDIFASLTGRRVALVHDWVTGFRGGEKVLAEIAALVPDADLYTLVYVRGSAVPVIENRRVNPASINWLPGVSRYYRWLLPTFSGWADRLDLSDYDLVLSTSHCVAKGARAPSGAPHVCYCHTPMRYVWDRFDDYFGHHRGLVHYLIQKEAARLREWDRKTASRVDQWMANSHFVRDRILEFYGVDPDRVAVVHPPVEVEHFDVRRRPPVSREDRYLVVSALVPYKRIDHAVVACARSGRRLDVAGTGPEAQRLQELARAHGGVEDFGITPLEATAAGLPVIARAEGGALDTVRNGVNGYLYSEDGVDALVRALDGFENDGRTFAPDPMNEWAAEFAPARFTDNYLRTLAPWLD
jgi:glycosyltransferase involved in cell wall biosynthesis